MTYANRLTPIAPTTDGIFYLHAIVPAQAQGWEGPGLIPGTELESLSAGDYAVLLSDTAKVPVPTGEEMPELGDMAAAHDRVLDRLGKAGSEYLPLPPDTLYQDLETVRTFLLRAAPLLRDTFRHVQGSAEWSVTVTVPARFTEDKNGQETLSWLHDELSRLARGAVRHDQGAPFAAAYLVDHRRAPRFAREAERIQAGFAPHGWVLDLRGPAPVHSFVRLGL